MFRWSGISGIVVAGVGISLTMIFGTLYSRGSADLSVQDDQPIRFSHQRHAGQLGIDCLYCHRFAGKSPVAGIPSVSLCMTCHSSLSTEQPETRVLATFWKEQRPIPWIRLQRLPDHVYFTHEMHLLANLTCTDCHGEVDRMPFTPRAPSFEMGWCLTCHKQRKASIDCLTCHK
jgi:hypothetical protein